MLAIQLGLLTALVLILIQLRRHRELEERVTGSMNNNLHRVMADTDELQRITAVLETRYQELSKRLNDSVSVQKNDSIKYSAQIRTHAQNIEALQAQYSELFKLLKTSVSIDVGYKCGDCGWLIFISKVDGRDMVKVQRLKPEMDLKDYKVLVEKLSWDCQHIAYIDSTKVHEHFLKDTFRRTQKSYVGFL